VEGKSFGSLCFGQQERDSWSEVLVAYDQAVSIITNDHWRLTRYTNDRKGQMFNLESDPDEQNDLYNIEEYANKKAELYERLVDISTRPQIIPRYCNMPLKQGKKYYPEKLNSNNGIPDYQGEESPALTDKLR
jgi:hypothetical protein